MNYISGLCLGQYSGYVIALQKRYNWGKLGKVYKGSPAACEPTVISMKIH